jgi:tetraacyldisaccharide 4'-kinase
MQAPRFWNQNNLVAKLLAPVGKIYGKIVQKRLQQEPEYISRLPVICVGNVTMGGSGKTPVVDSFAELLKTKFKSPAILMRGYGGSEKNPLWVHPTTPVAQCGDEALLHVRVAPTMVARNRAAGAAEIEKDPDITHIIMDDGLQNPSLQKTKSVVVVDGKNPFGNNKIFPAGPLRETIDQAIRRIDALVILGDDAMHLATQYQFVCPVFKAKLQPVNADEFKEKAVFAFAGIGNPQKFFDSLKQCDAVIAKKIIFPDHYPYRGPEIENLLAQANAVGAKLVTTRKDWVRLPESLQQQIQVLDITLVWDAPDALKSFLTSD